MDRLTALAICAAVAALVCAVATRLSIEPLRRWGVIDQPNQRSSHDTPTPRGGGLALVLALLAGGGVASGAGLIRVDPILSLGLVIVASIGFVDDVRGGLSRLVRIAVQVAVAVAVVWNLGGLAELPLPAPADLSLGVLGAPMAVLWIVAVLNLTNFLDGIDGFAAAQGLLCGAALMLASGLRGDGALMVVGVLLVAVCAGFLPFNWHPARVFLGDVGSVEPRLRDRGGALGRSFATAFRSGAALCAGDLVLPRRWNVDADSARPTPRSPVAGASRAPLPAAQPYRARPRPGRSEDPAVGPLAGRHGSLRLRSPTARSLLASARTGSRDVRPLDQASC